MLERGLPNPGDLVVTRRAMRAWVGDNERGHDGHRVDTGRTAIVLQRWRVGNQVRLRVIVDGKVVVFSHSPHCVSLNWSCGDEVCSPGLDDGVILDGVSGDGSGGLRRP